MANPDLVEDEFEGAGLKPGLEVWYIDDNVKPVRVPESSHGVFFSGCAYVLLRTQESDGSLSHDFCCWLGEDLSQAQVESIKVTVLELHGALKYETTPSWVKQSEGCAGFLTSFSDQCMIYRIGRFIPDAGVRNISLYMWIAHDRILQEVVCDRESLSDACIFLLDTETKIFLFNCSELVMEGPKKLVQQIKNTFHGGICEMALIGDGTMTDSDTKEFWLFFGGYGSLPSKFSTKNARGRLFRVVNGMAIPMEVELVTRGLLDTEKCYVVDSGFDVYVWMGIESSLQERNSASAAAKNLLFSFRRPKDNIVRVVEGSERLYFRTEFDYWPVTNVAGVNVEGLPEAPSSKEDCNGILEVWRMDSGSKSPLMGADRSKFYSGDSYIFSYTYPGELGEEHLVGTWFGLLSLEEDRISSFSEAEKIVESLKFFPVQVAMFEGNEPIQFLQIFQNFIVYKGGLSTGYKKFIATEGLQDAIALFRVQQIGPKNIQAIQVEPVASSLNSLYCYVLLDGSSVFTWFGEATTSEDHENVMRQLHLLKPNCQAKQEKEGSESDLFWDSLGGKLAYPSEAIAREVLNKGRLCRCSLPLGPYITGQASEFQVMKVKNFDLDTLVTEGIFILDLKLDIYVWVGQEARSLHEDALTVAKEFLDFKSYLSPKDKFSIFIIMEGSEPAFFRRMFKRPVVQTAEQVVRTKKPLVIESLQPMSKAVTELEAYVKGEDFQKEVIEFATDRNLLPSYFADHILGDSQATRKHLLRRLKEITYNLRLARSEHECLDFDLAKEAREFIKMKQEKNRKRSRTD